MYRDQITFVSNLILEQYLLPPGYGGEDKNT